MGGRSGQSIGNKGKTASQPIGKEKLVQLEKKKDQLEQKKAELVEKIKQNLLTKNKTAEDIREGERLSEEFVKTNKELLQTNKAITNTKDELKKTMGTTGNEFTINDSTQFKVNANGSIEFIGKLNTTPQTDYKISQDDLQFLKDNPNPDSINGFKKSGYHFTKDSWMNESKTQFAFQNMDVPVTEENKAILYYTADSKVNSGFYEGQTPTAADIKYKEMLNASLDKFGNKFDGTTYRGIGGDYANNLYKQVQQAGIGGEITFDSFQSSAYDPNKAFPGNTLIITKSKQGHLVDNFTHYYGEKEVLYKADSKFKITGFEYKNGKQYIYLED